jgi:hypothetical protein
MRIASWVLCPVVCSVIGCGNKGGDNTAGSNPKPNPYATHQVDRGIDTWVSFRSPKFGITADFPHSMPAEYPQSADAKLYPAMEKEAMIDGTIWGHGKGDSFEKHKFVIHLATIRKGAKDRD